MRRRAALALLVACTAAGAAPLQPTDDPAASEIWRKVHASVFGGRALQPAPWLALEAPARAIDGAFVPVAIRATPPAGTTIRRITLVIDANPSPVGAAFDFSAGSGRAAVETRVRVDAYSWVRAVAETTDGRLFASVRFVKASGGCSAPPGSDAAAALATMGKMQLRVDGDLQGREPVLAQLAISHPNHSGLAMDQFTRQFTPSDFVRKVEVTYKGQPVFSADVDFSISENPNFRFWIAPQGAGDLRAVVVDSRDRRFDSVQAVQ